MSRLLARVAFILCFAALAFALRAPEENWPRFRGAEGGVAADNPSLPADWGPTQNIAWKIDVPGRSWSSPVVWGDHIFLTTAINTIEPDTLLPVSAYVARSNGGTATFRDTTTTSAPYRWLVYDIDFKTGRIRWERE